MVARAEQLEQCHKLAIRQDLNKLEPSVTTEICQRLEALQRPWEAWAWRTLSAKRRGTVQADFAALKQARDQLLASYQPPAETFLLCGIDRQALPLPDQAKISLHNTAPEQASKAPAGEVRLVDRAKAIGLEFQYDGSDDLSDTKFYTHQVSGGGIGAFDYDLDGWCDLYFGQGGGDAHDPQGSKPNPLFRNLDGERFVQVPELVGVGDRGYGQGIAAGDFNQDGFADLLVANIGPCKLLLNQGDGTFRDVTEEIGLRTDAWTTSAAMADLDGDRLVDIVLINYLDDPTIFKLPCQHTNLVCRPQNYHEATNLFFQGQRELQVSPWAGINPNPPTPSIGFAAVVTNIDGRDGNDIYSADDGRPNQYWISEVDPEQAGRYRLREQANMRGCATGPQGSCLAGWVSRLETLIATGGLICMSLIFYTSQLACTCKPSKACFETRPRSMACTNHRMRC